MVKKYADHIIIGKQEMWRRYFKAFDRQTRAIAFDLISRRDGLSGWKLARKELLDSIRCTPEELQDIAGILLKKIIHHAYETVPYYRDTWSKYGLVPSQFVRTSDLNHYPFITKNDIRKNKSELVSNVYREESLDRDFTGGTTGTQTSFYRNHECTVSRTGRQWGILQLCGYRPGMKRALIWGVHSELPRPGSYFNLKHWFRGFACNQETLCCSVMSDHDMEGYYNRLLKFGPEILYGYPNAIEQIARYIIKNNLKPIRVDSIITTAERLTPHQRNLFHTIFGGEVFNLYCTREYGCIGFECGRHDGFHIDTGSVILEITKDGKPVNAGEMGEITVTDFLNYGMPLIRSKTGDMGVLASAPCGCGLPLPLLKSLDGRSTDILYRPDGSTMAGLMLTDLFADLPGIEAAQFVQNSIHELEVRLVVNNQYTGQTREESKRQVRELMGNEMIIHISTVSEINRNPRSGKYQEVICRVNQEDRYGYGKDHTV